MSVSNTNYNYDASADDNLDLSLDDQNHSAASSHDVAESEAIYIDSTSEKIIQMSVVLFLVALVAVLGYLDVADNSKTAELGNKRTAKLSVTATPTIKKYISTPTGTKNVNYVKVGGVEDRQKEPVKGAVQGRGANSVWVQSLVVASSVAEAVQSLGD